MDLGAFGTAACGFRLAYPHTPKTLITNVRMGDVETGDALVKNNALLLAVL
jgi:hypothetical protein